MIKATCFTNLDGYDPCQWPTKFLVLPKVGERVRAKNKKSLKVVAITHTLQSIKKHAERPFRGGHYTSYEQWEPQIVIELNK